MFIKIYDGAITIGGNKIYVGDGKHGIFLDFGFNFSTNNLYFRNFLEMRDSRGLNDPVEMGMLPPVNVYREDIDPENLKDSLEKIPLEAVLVTHAHMDHYGMVGWIDFEKPIVASPETIAIIKAYQDANNSQIGPSALYDARRELDSEKPLKIVKSTGGKMKSEEGARKYMLLRKIIFTEKPNEELLNFLTWQNNKGRMEYVEENIEYETLSNSYGDLPFTISAHTVDHSIYGAVGFVVEDESAKIAYTGDIRLHGERKEKSMGFAEMARNASVLIIEGTRIDPEKEEHETITEGEVKENCSEVIANSRGIVIVDFSTRNFERLKNFSEIAKSLGREMVITEKDAYVIEGLNAVGLEIDMDNLLIYDKPNTSLKWWQKYLRGEREKIGVDENRENKWESHYVSAQEVREDPDSYMLAFSLYDMPNMMDIKPRGGIYLYSSTEAFDEDMRLDFVILSNWLKKYNLAPVGFWMEGEEAKFDKKYHASGHVSPADLMRIIDTIDPEVIIPVHTEHPEWFSENYDKVKILKNGEKMEI